MQILHKLEDRDAPMERLYDMDDKEIGALIRHPHGGKVHNVAFSLKTVSLNLKFVFLLTLYTISLQLGYSTRGSF